MGTGERGSRPGGIASAALIVAGVGLILFSTRGSTATAAAAPGSHTVVEAARALPLGTVITANDVVDVTIAGSTQSPGVTVEQLLGRQLLLSVPKGEPIDTVNTGLTSVPNRKQLVALGVDAKLTPPQLAVGDAIEVVALAADGSTATAVATGTVVSVQAGNTTDPSAQIQVLIACDPQAALTISAEQLANHPVRILEAAS